MLLKLNFLAYEILEGTVACFNSLDAAFKRYDYGECFPHSVLLPKFSAEFSESGLEPVNFDFFEVSYSSTLNLNL